MIHQIQPQNGWGMLSNMFERWSVTKIVYNVCIQGGLWKLLSSQNISTHPPLPALIVDTSLRCLISELYKVKFPTTINSQQARSIASCICLLSAVFCDWWRQAVYTCRWFTHLQVFWLCLWCRAIVQSLSIFVYLPGCCLVSLVLRMCYTTFQMCRL